ncbi:E3 ubiquitin-protein ligase DTX3L1 isoform X2 [Gasterosteus aculeatus]
MGSGQSSDKLHCNRYLDGKGPRPLSQQATYDMKGKNRGLNDCQPEGHMTWMILPRDLPGFPEDHTLHVNFTFPDGIQTEKQPHPGRPYAGLQCSAYLPDNRDGRKVLQLLDKAFVQKLLFAVTTNADGQDAVTAASVPLKTRADEGPDGYPDCDYLETVTKLLRDKGLE